MSRYGADAEVSGSIEVSGSAIFNEGSLDADFRVESDSNTHMLYVDAGNSRVGIGTSSPDYELDVAGNIGLNEYLYHNGDADTYIQLSDDELVLYAGGRAAGIGLISAGAWYLFVSTVDRFWFPIMQLAAFWSQFQGGLAAAERVFALIDAESMVLQTDSTGSTLIPGDITFEKVDFHYEKNEQVLNDFSLQIDAGQSIALVGHTGAGKSSLVKLLARFYEFQSGLICVGGRDIRTFDLQDYRRQIGIVSQSPFLFSGSLADNIRYACPEASDSAILEVAHSIGDGEWLYALPDGIKTDVGERGSRLSLGQRQLVALNRVLLQDPTLFLLDEATASVDPFTESQIQEALDLIVKNRTSILIAHRLSTVRSADVIIVMRQGKIIERGNHSTLMGSSGHYADLYNTYFRHQSLEYIEAIGKN